MKTYFQVRERIEQSGRDQRWEFDRKKLFELTNYMALRLADLFEVTEVMEQFYNIFGPELKGTLKNKMNPSLKVKLLASSCAP